MRRRLAAFAPVAPLFACALLLPPAAGAGEAAAPPRDPAAATRDPVQTAKDWQVLVASYLWVTDLVADVSARDFSVHAEPYLWDIVQSIDLGVMGSFEVFHAPTRLFFDVDAFWARLSEETDAGPFEAGFGPLTFERPGLQRQVGPITVPTRVGPITVGPFDVDTGPVRVDIPRVEFALGPYDVESTTTESAVRASIGYRLLDLPLTRLLGGEAKDDDPRRFRADVFAGARYWYVKLELEIDSPPVMIPGFTISPSLVAHPRLMLPQATVSGITFGGKDVQRSQSTWWVDPIVGVRLGADLCDRLGVLVGGTWAASASARPRTSAGRRWRCSPGGSVSTGTPWPVTAGSTSTAATATSRSTC
jgi:hypothetical protein